MPGGELLYLPLRCWNEITLLTRGKPFTVGARVYSQVGPQAAASIVQKGVLNGGVGEGDVLLGEARVPFSLLKEVPFHYLPLRLQPPHPPQLPRCGCGSGVENVSTAHMTGVGGDCGADLASTRNCTSSGGACWSETSVLPGKIVPDSGLLGIGVRIIFPSPTVPDVPDPSSASYESSLKSSDLPPPAGAVSDVGREAATGGVEEMGDAIVLSVYEAEALVRAQSTVTSVFSVPVCVRRVISTALYRGRSLSQWGFSVRIRVRYVVSTALYSRRCFVELVSLPSCFAI